MPKTIKVTEAQVIAARLIIECAPRGIGHASPAVIAIADAQRRSVSDRAETRTAI